MENTKLEKMKDRATRRRDWVFSMSSYNPYAVYKNTVAWWAEFTGTGYIVYQYAFGFAHVIWEVKTKSDAINRLEYLIFNIEN